MGKALGSPSFLQSRAPHLLQPPLTLGSARTEVQDGRSGHLDGPGPAAPHTGDPSPQARAALT